MAATYRVKVFGKPLCDKCKTLNARMDKLLAAAGMDAYEKLYCDLNTEEGLVEFCEAECVNPQRVPAFVVTRLNAQSGEYEPIPVAEPGRLDELCGKSRLYQYLGLQTDYSESGRGIISPKMIAAVLAEAAA